MRNSLLLAAAAATAIAQPHHHAHRRSHIHHAKHALDKRALVEQVVTVTVLECRLGDRQIDEAECQQGINNGTLKFTDGDSGEVNKVATSLVVSQPIATPAVHAEVQPTAAVLTPELPVVQPAAPPAAATPVAPVAPANPVAPVIPPPVPEAQIKPAIAVPQANRVADSFGGSAGGAGASFPSGQLSCDEFPSDYGAVRADWLNIGGWLSVQKPGALVKRGGYNNIMTVVSDMCADGKCCMEGAFCSYACPTGYFKAQWPTIQGSTGQSVGGLKCENGKLVLTNPATNKLCVPAVQKVAAYVKNTMSQTVSICQTNYPGDEAMTIPIVVAPGATVPLPIIDMAGYWHTTEGKQTSAQYYINPAGVSHEQACKWQGKNTGNWAPLIIGAGYAGKEAFLSLFGNYPTQQTELLGYGIRIEGQQSMPCKYENGQICWGQGYAQCTNPLLSNAGCTVALDNDKSMTYVLY